MLEYTRFESPFGIIHIASTDKGICRITFLQEEQEFLKELHQSFGEDYRQDTYRFTELEEKLSLYFEGKTTDFNVTLDVRGTDFQRQVWLEIKRIRFGELRTYKDLAEAIGKPKAYRAVGNAVGSNPVPLIIPCHRVIRSDGSMGGFEYGIPLKLKLLKMEGVSLVNDGLHERISWKSATNVQIDRSNSISG